jgi:hypothetical protein
MDRKEFDKTHNVRDDGQIHLEPINLDCLTDTELELAATHPALHAEVKTYVGHLLKARKHRLAGKIEMALGVELSAERIYKKRIPQRLRW